MAPRKHPPEIRTIVKELFENGKSPDAIKELLANGPHNYPIHERTIQQWAKDGDWKPWRVTLNQIPNTLRPDPDTEVSHISDAILHLAILEAEKSAYRGDITRILQDVDNALRPGKYVLEYLRSRVLPDLLEKGEFYEPDGNYSFNWNLGHSEVYAVSAPSYDAEQTVDEDKAPSKLELQNEALRIKEIMFGLMARIDELEESIDGIEDGESE